MFGYVRPFVPELKVRQFAEYRAFYCGICRALGAQCGPVCRVFLQYDFVLLALALDITQGESAVIARSRCAVFPAKKLLAASGWAVEYAADAHGLLLLGKSMDDRADGGAMRYLTPVMRAFTRRAAKRRPELDRAVHDLILRQHDVENAGAHPDEASEPFAAFCAGMFAPPEAPEAHKEALSWLGRNLGRWIYFADALADIDEDAKKGRFNPLGTSREQAAERIIGEMDVCAQQALSALLVLPACDRAVIARNILEDGLSAAADAVLSGRKAAALWKCASSNQEIQQGSR